ncbi:MAG: SNF2-related protein, partial [Oscillospiraceae bacterium]
DKSSKVLEQELLGVVYRDIKCDINTAKYADINAFPLVTTDEYLSGNVRKKLQMAQTLYDASPSETKNELKCNIDALRAVQPVELTAAEIGARIGATWIPPEIYKQFIFEMLNTDSHTRSKIDVLYSKSTARWHVAGKTAGFNNICANTTFGTKRISAYHIFEQTLNLKDVRIFDVKIENGNEVRVFNRVETQIAQDKQELIKSKFTEWLWQDIDRREMLCALYNQTFNSTRPREYDGRHIAFYGMNPEITLEKHQVNAIAHIIYGGNTLLAHEVGAGKTYEMVAAAMESRRLGLCSKSLVVVPNHITEQWAAEWLQLYPSANILVAKKKDFETKNRKRFCARIATGDYDAIIIGHSQFEKIPMSKERKEAILQQQLDEMISGIDEAKRAKCENFTVKQMERSRKELVAKLAKLNDQSRKDNVVTFEELGVDRIFIDESHYFKNLFLMTKMRNVGGIAQTDAQKSSDLFMKCRYLDEITDGKGIIFATGTPISNSMVELYTIQRYLQYNALHDMGLEHFDEWAATFGETVTAPELAPEGTGYRAKTRFAKFYNLPELMSTFKEVADIQTADMLNLPVPKATFHTEVIKASEMQKAMLAELADRAEDIHGGSVDPTVDNMLKVTNDGRKLALDMRLINPLASDDTENKVSVCAKNIYQIWKKTTEIYGVQLVFCDLSTPKSQRPIELQESGDGASRIISEQFINVYDDLKRKLISKGIPMHEIAFIHDANTEVQKKELFAKTRSGQVRVLLGSTQKMGAGTNVQNHLVALHDLDCPWRPSDLAQRLGRIIRRGNLNPEVDIYRYVTEGTFDSYLYQLVENKQRFIAQIMTSKAPLRAAEDVDETALSYAEIKALATGNPLIIVKCNLDMDISRLSTLKSYYLSQKYTLEGLVLRKYPQELVSLAEREAGYVADIELLAANKKLPDNFAPMEILGTTHTEKEMAGKAILDACAKMTSPDAILLGKYRGFTMSLYYDSNKNEYRLSLKGTLTHSVSLGSDMFGNLTRIDNLLDKLSEKLENVRQTITDTKVQLENARTELQAPFAQEKELTEKISKRNELNILLNMDEPQSNVAQAPVFTQQDCDDDLEM